MLPVPSKYLFAFFVEQKVRLQRKPFVWPGKAVAGARGGKAARAKASDKKDTTPSSIQNVVVDELLLISLHVR